MTDHVRTQVKAAFKLALEEDPTLAGFCHLDRDEEFGSDELPAVNIHNIDSVEEAKRISQGKPGLYQRTIPVFVDCYARYATNVIAGVDDLAAAVEKELLKADSNIIKPPLIKDIQLLSTGISKTSDGNCPVAMARLTFSVTCFTRDADATVPV